MKKRWCMKCRTRHLLTSPHDQELDEPARRPGRHISTNSAANPLIRFRVSDSQLADLKQKGEKRGLSEHQEAKRRAFPRTREEGEPTR